jgi:hypothetical protein
MVLRNIVRQMETPDHQRPDEVSMIFMGGRSWGLEAGLVADRLGARSRSHRWARLPLATA